MSIDSKCALARTTSLFSEHLSEWANAFFQAKKVEGVSIHTLAFYKQQLGHFLRFCDAQVIGRVTQISSNDIRHFLLWLDETGHNPGGQHAAYRVLKTFLRWFENEVEPEDWRNPINKIKAPKVGEEPLEPVALGQVRAMVEDCDNSFLGRRDNAMLLVMLDTGCRAREFLAINLEDVHLATGAILIRQGKGRKPRMVFIGKHTRKALRAYLKSRPVALMPQDEGAALWVTDDGMKRLSYGGLRAVLAKRAGMDGTPGTLMSPAPTAHKFRRAFAINMLRNGVDLITLARLMGHTDLKVLRRYLKYTETDLQEAHAKASPVDQWTPQNKLKDSWEGEK